MGHEIQRKEMLHNEHGFTSDFTDVATPFQVVGDIKS
jgi:hypothetical protein